MRSLASGEKGTVCFLSPGHPFDQFHISFTDRGEQSISKMPSVCSGSGSSGDWAPAAPLAGLRGDIGVARRVPEAAGSLES